MQLTNWKQGDHSAEILVSKDLTQGLNTARQVVDESVPSALDRLGGSPAQTDDAAFDAAVKHFISLNTALSGVKNKAQAMVVAIRAQSQVRAAPLATPCPKPHKLPLRQDIDKAVESFSCCLLLYESKLYKAAAVQVQQL